MRPPKFKLFETRYTDIDGEEYGCHGFPTINEAIADGKEAVDGGGYMEWRVIEKRTGKEVCWGTASGRTRKARG